MKTLRNVATVIAMPVLLSISAPSSADLIYGSAARSQFEGYQASLGDNLVDFNSFAAQTNLTTQIPGLTFRTTYARYPTPVAVNLEVNVICSPSNPYNSTCTIADGINRIIGGVRPGGITDGQSRYEIVFNTGVLRAGVERIFNTYSLTRFYSGATLLGEHRNTMNTEFVGFVSDAVNPITRIEMDGLASGSTYMVGYVNDLFYGTAPIPEPETWAMLLAGLALIGFAVKRRRQGE